MGGLGWIILSCIILLAVTLLYLKKKDTLKTGQYVKGRGTTTTAQAETMLTRTGASEAQPMKRMEAELEEYRNRLEGMVEQRTIQLMSALQRMTYDETLEALAASLNLRDHDTATHSRRVALYSLEMAKRLNFSPTQLKQLERGAYLHDLGKIGIPGSILLKPAKLTPEETAMMQTHVPIGYKFMSRVAFLASAAEIVLAHHECYNGTGYPQGLAGEEIPLGARIVAVANAFDAMRSDWPYRRGQPYSVARAEIQREAGKQFDPKVVDVFLSIPEETWEKIRLEVAARNGNSG
jgi:HD-GYP domain-containing protein (c-di-GMP phosphodiesterase class II)